MLLLACIDARFLFSCLGGGVSRQEREVTLTLKHGVEAKNYDDVSAVVGVILAYKISH